MKTILMYEIQKSVMWKMCCFWFFNIFIDCYCACNNEVKMTVSMCKSCSIDVLSCFSVKISKKSETLKTEGCAKSFAIEWTEKQQIWWEMMSV